MPKPSEALLRETAPLSHDASYRPRGSRLVMLLFCECEGQKMGSQGMAQEQGNG
jgi:hypothetical protein